MCVCANHLQNTGALEDAAISRSREFHLFRPDPLRLAQSCKATIDVNQLLKRINMVSFIAADAAKAPSAAHIVKTLLPENIFEISRQK